MPAKHRRTPYPSQERDTTPPLTGNSFLHLCIHRPPASIRSVYEQFRIISGLQSRPWSQRGLSLRTTSSSEKTAVTPRGASGPAPQYLRREKAPLPLRCVPPGMGGSKGALQLVWAPECGRFGDMEICVSPQALVGRRLPAPAGPACRQRGAAPGSRAAAAERAAPAARPGARRAVLRLVASAHEQAAALWGVPEDARCSPALPQQIHPSAGSCALACPWGARPEVRHDGERAVSAKGLLRSKLEFSPRSEKLPTCERSFKDVQRCWHKTNPYRALLCEVPI